MFERFTQPAREVLVLAQEDARVLGHDYIGGEHLLLGLLRAEEGLGARVLESLDITLERARAEVVRCVGSGAGGPTGQIPFRPEAKRVLELSLREALALAHDHIDTEHLLLALVREEEGLAGRILVDLGADSETIRNEVIRRLCAPRGRPRAARSLRGTHVPDALLEWAGEPLRRLAREVEEELGRPADAGDLLVLLASLRQGLAARTLAALGISPEQLARAAEQSRRDDARSDLALLKECEDVRVAKEAVIDAQDFERAASLRDRERELRRQAHGVADDELLAEVRVHLGLSTS